MTNSEKYWSDRYQNLQTQWDIGYPSTPLISYFDKLKDKAQRILIPGCGNAYEAQYLHEQGFNHVKILDIAQEPLMSFKQRVPSFRKENLINEDFFNHEGIYDLIIEQTFFCAIEPSLRERYILKINKLLSQKGKLIGVLFNQPLNEDRPPYGGSRNIYYRLFSRHMNVELMEACYNSIPPRRNNELFIKINKKRN